MNYKYKYLIISLFLIGIMFMSGTFAWLTWETNSSQSSEVVFTVEQDFMCSVDGGGDITSNDVTLAPADCTNSEFAVFREVKVNSTLYSPNMNVAMDLWLDINSIGSGLSSSSNFKYVLSTSSTSCTEGVVKSGNFKNKTIGGQVSLFTEKVYESTTTDTYYLYVWLDSAETSTDTMNQVFNLSLNGECRNEPIQEKTAYAVYSADDTSLRFYKSSDEITAGSMYNGLTATAVYTGFEDSSYSTSQPVPWYSYRENITNVVVEDEISPISTAYWFYGFKNTTSMDLTKLNVSSVTSMGSMFYNAGYNATTFDIGDLSGWNVSSVTNMKFMFSYAGRNATTFDIGDLSGWDVSSVTNMYGMFFVAGRNATTFDIGDLSGWDVSSVTDMSYMFCNAGYKATTWSIGDIFGWDVSSVTNMSYMFQYAGNKATTWSIGDISGWDVSSVTNMSYMFQYAGYSVTYSLDLSSWDVEMVTNHTGFNDGVTSKVTAPTWAS